MIKQKITWKHKILIVCRDWNINFLQTSPQKRELNSLFLRYNLKHFVNVPTRIIKTTASLMDVVITNEKKSINSLRVTDIGLSENHKQTLSISISDFSNIPHIIKKNSLVKLMFRNFFTY